MKAVELVALASAHGTDLRHMLESSSNVKGIAAPRRREKGERGKGFSVLQSVKGPESRTYRRPQWCVGEAGNNVPRMPWLACLHSFAGDSQGYVELHRGLMVLELKIATENNWPMSIRKADGSRGYYQAELATLVLDVEMYPRIFAEAPALYAACLGATPDLYDHVISHWYDSLKGEYQRWLASGLGIIQRWINEPEAA